MIRLLRNHKELLFFTFFNLLDKAIIVLMPFVVLTLFQEKEIYIQLEFIISTVNIVATVTDLGLNGYMFFLYQQTVDKNEAIRKSRQISEVMFLSIAIISSGIVFFHLVIWPLHFLILFIVIRTLFNYITTFLTSYFRLIDKPVQVLYMSLAVNSCSLILLLGSYASNQNLSLWLIFIPQLALISYYLIRIFSTFDPASFSYHETIKMIVKSLEFSWPSIIQVFLMVYMANYGKVNALDKLSQEDAVFLGYSLRFCMLIQLAHASLVGFYAKSILAGEDLFQISTRIMKLYVGTLTLTAIVVVSATVVYQIYIMRQVDFGEKILITALFSMYTLCWCFYSYLEMYYARINRNRIKLYLTFAILFVFIVVLKFLNLGLLQNIAFAMFFSILVGFVANILVLKRLNFRLAND